MPDKHLPHHFLVAMAWASGCIFGGAISNASHAIVAMIVGMAAFFWCQRYVRIEREMIAKLTKANTEYTDSEVLSRYEENQQKTGKWL